LLNEQELKFKLSRNNNKDNYRFRLATWN